MKFEDYAYNCPKKGFVYFLHDNVHNVGKIGLTGDIKSRFKSIQNNYPVELDKVYLEVDNMGECENYLHRRFHNRRSHGEWFKCVSKEEFNIAIGEYINQKRLQVRSNADFFRFLYNTEYELANGVPHRVWRMHRADIKHIALFSQDRIKDKAYVYGKLNNILSNLNCSIKIKHNSDPAIDDFCNKNNIQSLSFSFTSNKSEVDDLIKESINGYYGVILVAKKPDDFYVNILDYAKADGAKVRHILPTKN